MVNDICGSDAEVQCINTVTLEAKSLKTFAEVTCGDGCGSVAEIAEVILQDIENKEKCMCGDTAEVVPPLQGMRARARGTPLRATSALAFGGLK